VMYSYTRCSHDDPKLDGRLHGQEERKFVLVEELKKIEDILEECVFIKRAILRARQRRE